MKVVHNKCFGYETGQCTPFSCHQGGFCTERRLAGIVTSRYQYAFECHIECMYCLQCRCSNCPVGHNGPQCELLARKYDDGFSWTPPLPGCADWNIKFEFLSNHKAVNVEGIILLYNGPLAKPVDTSRMFIACLVHGSETFLYR